MVLTGEGTAFSAGMDIKEYFRERRIISFPSRSSFGSWQGKSTKRALNNSFS